MKHQYPELSGFQNTLLGQNLRFAFERKLFIQILHGSGHWFCISGTSEEGEVEVIDSFITQLPQKAVKQVAALVQTKTKELRLNFLNTSQQRRSSDCGLYAIATATAICAGKDPCTQMFHQDQMRAHLLKCLINERMTLFPAEECDPTDGRIKNIQNVEIFCHCRQPSCGKMIQCPWCSEWFHHGCETISQKQWKKPTTWICSNCVCGV